MSAQEGGEGREIVMVPVDSTNIGSVGYTAEGKVLRVKFTNGGTYDYADVPAEIHAALMAAESKGRHLRAHVIGAGYKATKLPPEPSEAKEGEVLPAGAYEAGVGQEVREGVARRVRN